MKTYLDCWITTAKALFPEALAGGPQLIDDPDGQAELSGSNGPGLVAEISGDVAGRFSVILESRALESPLLGDGVDQASAWKELLREVVQAAAGELLAATGQRCHVDSFGPGEPVNGVWRAFRLISANDSWRILIQDGVRAREGEAQASELSMATRGGEQRAPLSPGVELLMDVELEAALRFGCREMPLGEILELGPGDVVELDRHIADPVDLVVGDRIVARGDVVLVNGNFGLRVTQVAEPQKRLESIRCLF